MGDDVERLHGLTDLITPMAIRVAATLRLGGPDRGGHDWNDTDATAILRWCAQAAGPDRRVLMGNSLIDCTVL